MAKFLPLILCTVLLNALSQIFMKHGMAIVGKFEYSASHLLVLLSRAATNPFIIVSVSRAIGICLVCFGTVLIARS